jgi:hypothetical protein
LITFCESSELPPGAGAAGVDGVEGVEGVEGVDGVEPGAVAAAGRPVVGVAGSTLSDDSICSPSALKLTISGAEPRYVFRAATMPSLVCGSAIGPFHGRGAYAGLPITGLT